MFGIGGFELFIIVVFIFVIFGPNKLPEIIKITGTAIKKFRKAKAEMDHVLQEEIVDPVMKVANEPDPPKNEEKTKATNDNSSEKKSSQKSTQKKTNNKSTNNTKKTTTKKTTTKKTTTKKTTAKKTAEKKGGK